MTKRAESIDCEALLPSRELPNEASTVDSERWVVLIGEGCDSDQVIDFLRDQWPDA